MKVIKQILAAAAVAGALAFQPAASAVSAGDIIGTIDDGIPPGNNETGWVELIVAYHNSDGTGDNPFPAPPNEEITVVNFSTLDADLPAVDAGSMNKNDDPDVPAIVSGVLYVLGKYGAGQDGQISVVWYTGGADFEIPQNFGNSGALSHYTTWNEGDTRVPDGGATAALLGLGLLGMAAIRRKS